MLPWIAASQQRRTAAATTRPVRLRFYKSARQMMVSSSQDGKDEGKEGEREGFYSAQQHPPAFDQTSFPPLLHHPKVIHRTSFLPLLGVLHLSLATVSWLIVTPKRASHHILITIHCSRIAERARERNPTPRRPQRTHQQTSWVLALHPTRLSIHIAPSVPLTAFCYLPLNTTSPFVLGINCSGMRDCLHLSILNSAYRKA